MPLHHELTHKTWFGYCIDSLAFLTQVHFTDGCRGTLTFLPIYLFTLVLLCLEIPLYF